MGGLAAWVAHVTLCVLMTSRVTSPRVVAPRMSPPHAPVTDDRAGAMDKWLDDYTNNKKPKPQEMQSDSAFLSLPPASPEGAQCPPPPQEPFRQDGCEVVLCKSDLECKGQGQGQKCCNNGCKFTCMATMPRAPVVDWLKEPPRRTISGMSWLVPGPETQPQDTCTTSQVWEADEAPLLCPHGSVCHIEDLGDPDNGIANSGRCIQEPGQKSGSGRSQPHFRLKAKLHEDGGCVVEKRGGAQRAIIPAGSTFPYHKHICECHQGAVTCFVGGPRKKS